MVDYYLDQSEGIVIWGLFAAAIGVIGGLLITL